MNLICKLLGHKWRDTSYWVFVRIHGDKLKRKVVQKHCDKCNVTEVFRIEPWQADE